MIFKLHELFNNLYLFNQLIMTAEILINFDFTNKALLKDLFDYIHNCIQIFNIRKTSNDDDEISDDSDYETYNSIFSSDESYSDEENVYEDPQCIYSIQNPQYISNHNILKCKSTLEDLSQQKLIFDYYLRINMLY